jgi:hypothetical protein
MAWPSGRYGVSIRGGTLLAVRWERLFDDLEAQLEAADREELSAEVADRTRREVAMVSLAGRLGSALGGRVELSIEGFGALCGSVRRVGQGWVLLDAGPATDTVVAWPAILAVRGLPASVVPVDARGEVAARLDLGHILRGIARDRSPVVIVMRDGSRLAGTIDRVGADFVDLAEHPADEPRRAESVSGVRTLAVAGVSVVRPV